MTVLVFNFLYVQIRFRNFQATTYVWKVLAKLLIKYTGAPRKDSFTYGYVSTDHRGTGNLCVRIKRGLVRTAEND